ncbi:MAG: addiction module toxin RelE [Candidatus Methylacidiphilales bacterium]|nr:addiction module toxin RelE [Candidatus Methylacidiphilales bacterium]
MMQIVFTPTSSAEMSQMPKLLQLEVLDQFHVLTPNFFEEHPDLFGVITQDERKLFRYRAKDYRIYFEKTKQGLTVHRVLHKNTLKDFFFRSSLPGGEDEELQKNPQFWKMIDDPERHRGDSPPPV